MQLPLSLENLGELDNGSAAAIIDANLEAACRDLADRGEDGKPRKVVIEIEMKRRKNGDAEINVKAKATVPQMRTADTTALIRQRGDGQPAKLIFQGESRDDPRQTLLQDRIDETEEKAAKKAKGPAP